VPEADIGIAPIRQPRGPERLLGVGGTLFRFHSPWAKSRIPGSVNKLSPGEFAVSKIIVATDAK
jgi:hypothetical protein